MQYNLARSVDIITARLTVSARKYLLPGMADGRRRADTGFDLAALPNGPFGTIIQSLGVKDKICLQLVCKSLHHALQQPQVR